MSTPDGEAATAYDELSARYAQLERTGVVHAYLRQRSLELLRAVLPKSGALLELGCGTGVEALALAEAGAVRVVAYDPAPGMVSAARKAVADAGLGHRVEVRTGSATEALRDVAARKEVYAGAWSSFALGYDDALGNLAPGLARAIPDGSFVFTVRNRWCLLEPWSIPLRVRGTYRHKVAGHRVPIRHEARRSVARQLAPWFRVGRCMAMPVFLPPPRYQAALARLPGLAQALKSLDRRCAALFPWNRLGDHMAIVAQRQKRRQGERRERPPFA